MINLSLNACCLFQEWANKPMWEGHRFSKVMSLGLQITSWRSSKDEPVSLRIDTFAITDFYSLIPPYYTDIHFVKFTILVRWICIYLLFGVWYFINSGRLLLGLTWLEKKKKIDEHKSWTYSSKNWKNGVHKNTGRMYDVWQWDFKVPVFPYISSRLFVQFRTMFQIMNYTSARYLLL